MKFSEISQSDWPDLKPYLDTCLLPVTGLSGTEEPWQATAALERLRDLLDAIEIPFKGRVVTYPALHYIVGDSWVRDLSLVCRNLKECGFAFVIAIVAGEAVKLSGEGVLLIADCDLLLEEADADQAGLDSWKQQVNEQVKEMWSSVYVN